MVKVAETEPTLKEQKKISGLFTEVFFCCFLCHSFLKILLLSEKKTEVPGEQLLVCHM